MIPHSAPALGEAEAAAAARVIHSGHLAQGSEVAAFEEECAALTGRRHGVAVNSGTSAIHLCLAALDLPRDARVAIPAYACASLPTAVNLHGARACLVDIGEDYCLDVSEMPKADAVLVAHLFGAQAALPQHACVIEDIAQSIGGSTGRSGIAAVGSFYATKMITTGEGGIVLTDDEGLAAAARDLRDYDNRDDFKRRFNYKMTDIQAAIGREQLKRLPVFVERRRSIAARYSDAFKALPIVCPHGEGHVYFRYVMATPDRDALQAHLHARGVDAKRPVYRPSHHYFGGQFLQCEKAHRECLSIPIYPALTDESVQTIIDEVRGFFG